jgi:hypothetical protein
MVRHIRNDATDFVGRPRAGQVTRATKAEIGLIPESVGNGTAIAIDAGMRRVFREALMSAGTVVILLLLLIAFDDRVRDQVSRRVVAHPSQELASVGRQARDLTSVIAAAARDQSLGHAPLLIFTLGAAVLVLFMLRT